MQDDLGLAKDLLALSNELGGAFEKPPLLRITLYARPGPGEFDVLVDPPGPERVVVDLRAGHREPSTPESTPSVLDPKPWPEVEDASEEPLAAPEAMEVSPWL